MIEGILGFIITSLFSISEKPLKGLNYNRIFMLFVFLILYFVLSGGKNIYRILTIKRYSPMTKIIADSFLDPLLIIVYYFFRVYFSNYYIFIFSLILSIIMNFFGLVFNDFLILYCCNLEHDTYYEVSKRAYDVENEKPLQDCEMSQSINDDYDITFPKNENINL